MPVVVNNNLAPAPAAPAPLVPGAVEEPPFPTGPLYFYALRTGADDDIEETVEKLKKPYSVRLRAGLVFVPAFFMTLQLLIVWLLIVLYYTYRSGKQRTSFRRYPDIMRKTLCVLVVLDLFTGELSWKSAWLLLFSYGAYWAMGLRFSPSLLDLQRAIGLETSWFDDLATHILYRYRNLNNLHAMVGRCEERLNNDFHVGQAIRKLTEQEKHANLLALSKAAALIHQLLEMTDFGDHANQLKQTPINGVLNELSRSANDFTTVGQHSRR